MHRALLIDEILQEIFDQCSEDGSDERGTFNRLAGCCKAWLDPALDRLWKRLPSVAPLLSLIPESGDEEMKLASNYMSPDMAIFRSYAARVRSVAHQYKIDTTCFPSRILLEDSDNACLLPNLTSARITVFGWGKIQTRLSVSPRLRNLELNFGFRPPIAPEDTIVCGLIHNVAKISCLERLYVRGITSERVLMSISTLKSLRTLTVSTVTSLTADALVAISSLPVLSQLTLYAGHLDHEELTRTISTWRSKGNVYFPSLQSLGICGRASVVDIFLQNLPHDTLCHLVLDADGGMVLRSSWTSVLTRLTTVAPRSLKALTIKHNLDVEDDDDPKASKYTTIHDLRPLANLNLHRFTLDSLIPPDLSDADLEEICKWWPDLTHLDLGDTIIEEPWHPRLTMSCLTTLSRRCQKLEILSLVLDTTSAIPVDSTLLQPATSHPLHHLCIASPSAPDVHKFSAYLKKLFPSLISISPGPENGNSEKWRQLGACFHSTTQC